MSIHSSSSAEQIGHGMHGAINGIAGAAVTAWMMSRQDAGRRDAENAAAAQGARSSVLRSTVHGLREQIAQERHDHREEILDLEADATFFRAENARLLTRMSELEAAVIQLDGQRRVLAAALTEARAA